MRNETKKAPTIRFRGFTDDWEQRKLGELLKDLYNGQTPSRFNKQFWGGNINWLTSGELNRGIVEQTLEKITEKGRKKAHLQIVPKGTFVIAITGLEAEGTRGNCAIVNINTALNQSCMALFPDENKLNIPYLFQWYRLVGEKYGIQFTQGTKQQSYNADIIKKLKIVLPQIEEQKKIARWLQKIDNLITLHQRKLNQLKTLKKYFLQNMFPAKGEKVPRIRFKGFTGDWEQRKLEDLASFSKGAGYSKSDLQVSGTPIVLYGRLYTKYETVIKDVDTFVDALANSVYSQGGEVIVPASGETAEDISIASVVEKPGIVLGGDLNIIHPSDDLDSTFLAISISNGNPHKEMAKRAQGKSVVHLHNNDLAQIKLLYPSVTEQRKISQYFSGLDTLITLHQHKLDQLQIMKKFMLQNMFI